MTSQHPLVLVKNLLNLGRNDVTDTHTIRNALTEALKDYYKSVTVTDKNIIYCEQPTFETKYTKVFVKVLGEMSSRDIAEYNTETMNRLREYGLGKTSRIIVSPDVSESSHQTLKYYNIDYIKKHKDKWIFIYLGKRVKKA